MNTRSKVFYCFSLIWWWSIILVTISPTHMIIISSCWYCEDTLTSGNHQSVWLMRITMSHQKNFILTSCWLYKTLFLTLLGWSGFFNQFHGLESCELTMLVDNFVWRHENWWSVPGYNEGTEIFCHHIVFQTSPHSPARLSDCTAMMTRSHNHVIKFLIIENINFFLFLDTLALIDMDSYFNFDEKVYFHPHWSRSSQMIRSLCEM